MVDDRTQVGKSPVTIEAALQVAEQPLERRGPVHPGARLAVGNVPLAMFGKTGESATSAPGAVAPGGRHSGDRCSAGVAERELIKKPRQRNLWVTDTVEWCPETRRAYPLRDGEGFSSFS